MKSSRFCSTSFETRRARPSTGSRRQRVTADGKSGKVLRVRPEDQWVTGISVPRILADEVFAQAQQRLRQNAALARRHQQRFYLLKGLVRCGVCGRAMPGDSFRGVRCHRCTGRRLYVSDPPCPSRSVQAEPLEALVWNQVVRLLRQPKVVLAEARRWLEARVTDRDELAMQLAEVENALAQDQDKRERMLTLHQEGEITHPELVAHLGAIQRERDRLQAEREHLQARLAIRTANETQAAQLEAAIKQFGNRVDRLTAQEQFRLVHDFVERVIVRPDGGIELCNFIPVPEQGPEVSNDAVTAGLRPRRQDDVIARVGGDEFAVLAIMKSDRVGEVVRAVLSRLRARLATLSLPSGHRLSMSVGHAAAQADGEVNLDALLKQADRSLYEQKRAGRPVSGANPAAAGSGPAPIPAPGNNPAK